MGSTTGYSARTSILSAFLQRARNQRGIAVAVLGFLAIYAVSAVVAEAAIVLVLLGAGVDLRASMIPDTLLTRAAPLYGFMFFAVGTMVTWRRIHRRPLAQLGLSARGILRDYPVGVALGSAGVLASAGVAAALGGIGIDRAAATLGSMPALVLLGGYCIQGFAEELLTRGYLLTRLTDVTTVPKAVAVSSLVFAVPHLPGILSSGPVAVVGLVNTVLFSALMSVLYLSRGSIWLVAAVHSAWNFMLSVVLGLTVSGGSGGRSLLPLAVVDSASAITGGSYGLEASVIVTAGLGLAMLWALGVRRAGAVGVKVAA